MNWWGTRKVGVRLPQKREFKLPWREAGTPDHHDDRVDSDQWVVNKELSRWEEGFDPLVAACCGLVVGMGLRVKVSLKRVEVLGIGL